MPRAGHWTRKTGRGVNPGDTDNTGNTGRAGGNATQDGHGRMTLPAEADNTPAAARRYQDMLERLRAQGKRLTPQRLAILEHLSRSRAHPSAEIIFRDLSARFPSMSLATVYKTLTMLKEHGQVLELGFAGQESRFDGHIPHPHPHLVCTRCGAIVDPPEVPLEEITQAMAQATGFRILSHRLDFYGLCPACRKGE